MSPEQAKAQDVDYRSDQFSLGLVLYEMLSGKPAFEKPSAVQTMSAIVEDDPPPIERTIPTQLRWILDRCLAKEREGRYESTRDLARELAQLRDHFSAFTGTGAGQQPALGSRRRRRWMAALPVICAVVGAGLAWCVAAWLRDPTAVDLWRYQITPFATALTMQSYPVWSPDAKSIAFVGEDEPGGRHLFVQAFNAPNAVQITWPDAVVNGGAPPVWSPDSRSLYFRCAKDGHGGALCRVPAGGGSSVLVQPSAQAASISPDGRTLVFWKPSEGLLSLWIASPPEAAPRRYEPMPFEAKQAYNNAAVAFSPDGTQILLSVALDTRGETSWLMPWPPGKARRLFAQTTNFAFTPQPSWLPDSRYLIFADRSANMPSRLFMADTKTDRYWPVFAQDRPAVSPSVCPDGSHVAYASALSHADVIAVPVGDGPIRTVLGSSRTEERVDASPVSPQITYITDRRGVPEVWIKSLAEGWERPLLTPDDVETDGEPAQTFLNPVFSPDGRRIVVVVKSRLGIYLYTTFATGGTPVRATSANGTLETAATWSPDGNWLAYSGVEGDQPKLMKVRPGSGEPPVTIAKLYGSAIPRWSPTGEWIADYENGDRLVIVSPEGKNVRTLSDDYGPVAWSRDGKTLYQVREREPALVAIDVATGKQRKLRDLTGLAPFSNGSPGLSAALTSDGKNIVYTVNRPRQEIWILDGIQEPVPWYKRLLSR
jgi:eukaryotic-like serine/threonine-protein kinase